MSDGFEARQGGCLCGAVRYEVTGDASWTAYCHCHSCRLAVGSPVSCYSGFPDGQFRFIEGEAREYNSSPGVTRTFCGTCGTPLTYKADRFPGEIHIHTGTFDEPERFAPRGHVYFGERIEWFDTADTLRRKTGLSG